MTVIDSPGEHIKEDVWIPTSCWMCYNACAIRVRRINGTAVSVEGNPDSPVSNGRLCPRGTSALMTLYDPNRITKPLKRTNPQKGIGIDPKWIEITWEEALDTIIRKLQQLREEDPRQFMYAGTTTCASLNVFGIAWGYCFGSRNRSVSGGSIHCGCGAHEVAGLEHAAWSIVPDFDLCKYTIYFGASKGHSAGHVNLANAAKVANARVRDLKLVVVDPMCNFAATKAAEWVPIRTGTDGAMALAIINVLLNETGVYDAEYIKKKTNGPYMIKADGHYMRDKNNSKPLIWDPLDAKARCYDDPDVKDFAIEGEYEIDGVACQPAFALLKNHIKGYTPEWASEITTVPATTIRRIATEFGEAASIGSTIVIDGKELPYRPVAVVFFRGAEGHMNSFQTSAALGLLNQIVGAADLPGGCLGISPTCFGYPETGKMRSIPKAGVDGLMEVGNWLTPHPPYPPEEPEPPEILGLNDLFCMSVGTPIQWGSDREQLREQFKLPYRRIKFLLNWGANLVMQIGNAEVVAEELKTMDFIVSFNITMNETAEFADIVLPDTCFLERNFPASTWPLNFNYPSGLGQWSWGIYQPVVKPPGDCRDFMDVLLEITYRLGGDMPEKFHAALNHFIGADLVEPYKLEPDKRYTWDKISDRVLRSTFGPDKGLEWFQENGLIKWPKKVEEVYWRHFLNVRVPVYFEHVLTVGEKVRELTKEHGFDLDMRFYSPLPLWIPCASLRDKSDEFNMFAFYYRDTLHTDSTTYENPWLDEASLMNPYTYNITINEDRAKNMVIKERDIICVESSHGHKVKGRAHLSQCIHPDGVGIAGAAGHWAKNLPIAEGKGVHFDELIELNMNQYDQAVFNLDTCAAVKIYRAKE